jgi:hypothetical protein
MILISQSSSLSQLEWHSNDFKGQCHEIFDPRFFRQSITPRPLINTLKYFRFLFRIRRAITEYVLVQRYGA